MRGRCQRKAYYLYLYKGKGVDSPSGKLDLNIGLVTHKGQEVLLRTGDPDAALEAVVQEGGRLLKGDTHHQMLTQALLMGWVRVSWEDFKERFEVLAIEEELPPIQIATGIGLPIRADAVVRERSTGLIYIINWKTMRDKKDFTSKWKEEVQAWTEALGWEQATGQRVDGVLFCGFYKGPFKDGGHWSALTHGYKRALKGGEVVYSPKWASGWTRFPTWEEEGVGGLLGWVSWFPKALLEEMFPVSPPVLKNNEIVIDWLEQWVRWETDSQHILETGSERDKELRFQQEFSHFNCKWCPFKRVCFKEASVEDLIAEGRLEVRVDHHLQKEEAPGE